MKKGIILIFLVLFKIYFGLAQGLPIDKHLQDYLSRLKKRNVDSLIILEVGCVGCEVLNGKGQAVTDGKTVYVIHKGGKETHLKMFDNFQLYKSIRLDSTTLFSVIEKYKEALAEKDRFYKQENSKKSNRKGNVIFLPPRPIHYSYETFNINLPDLKTEFTLINGEKDSRGYIIIDKDWFVPAKEIITRIRTLEQASEK